MDTEIHNVYASVYNMDVQFSYIQKYLGGNSDLKIDITTWVYSNIMIEASRPMCESVKLKRPISQKRFISITAVAPHRGKNVYLSQFIWRNPYFANKYPYKSTKFRTPDNTLEWIRFR